MYNEGISEEGELIALGEQHGLITKAGSSYSYQSAQAESESVKLGRGYDATRQFLAQKENKKLKNQLMKEIKQALKKNR